MVRRTDRRGAGEPNGPTEVLGQVERAKSALVEVVPSPRGIPGSPLAEALLAFEANLRQARETLQQDAASPAPAALSAIDESLARAQRLRLAAPSLDYEGLVSVLADLMAPLEVFEESPPSAWLP